MAPRTRALAALLLGLLAGCAAAPAGREIVLESAEYGCGAEEGLGCGLRLAPLLSDLDALAGVEESRTSWDGRWIRVTLAPGAEAERVAAEAAALVGGEPRRADALAQAPEAVAERWFTGAETVELSRHEAGVLAARYAAELGAEVGLGAAAAQALEDALREELTAAFERAHAAGGGIDRLWAELPAARERFEPRVAPLLSDAQRARLGAYLDRELGR